MANAKETAQTYYENMNQKYSVVSRYSRNLTLQYLQNKLEPCYHREMLIDQIQRILLRKNKTNVLLTGAAGCGKTAILEGLAAVIAQRKVAYEQACLQEKRKYYAERRKWKERSQAGDPGEPCPEYQAPPKPFLCDCVLYELSLTAMVSGSRYRGDFEERVRDLLRECKHEPNIILFIDEFHLVQAAGAAEGSPGAAQLLKPALARNEIRVIGATTTEEKKLLLEDKAFARRFTQLEVKPLTGDPALETAQNILRDYCAYHQVTTRVQAGDLLAQVQYFLPNTVFPDNLINVVDETLAGAVFDGLKTVDMSHFNETLSRMTGKVILSAGSPDQSQNPCVVA